MVCFDRSAHSEAGFTADMVDGAGVEAGACWEFGDWVAEDVGAAATGATAAG